MPKPVTATVTIKKSTGQTVYTGSFSMNTGMQTFQWDGRDAQRRAMAGRQLHDLDHRQGRQRPDGGDPERDRGRGRFRRPDQERQPS